MTHAPGVAALTAIAVTVLVTACSSGTPQEPAGGRTPDDSAAAAPAASSGAAREGRLFVTNEMSGDLSIIDVPARRVVATLPLGGRPRGIKVSPDGATLYVALSGSPVAPPGTTDSRLPPPDPATSGIGVVDIRERRLLRVIPAGSDPEQLAVSDDGKWLFVANGDAAQTTVVDAGDGRVIATVKVGDEPEGVDLRPDGHVVYVTSEGASQVAVIDARAPKLLATFAAGPRPRSTAFLPDSSRAYISAENGSSITLVDAIAHRVIGTIPLAGQTVRPMGVVSSRDGRHIFVTSGRGRSVIIIETATNKPVAAVEVGERPWGIAVSPDGGTVFTANGPSNDVSFVDVARRTVLARVAVGDRPWGIAFVP